MSDKVGLKSDTGLMIGEAIERTNVNIPKLIKVLERLGPSENPIENVDAVFLLETIIGDIEDILASVGSGELIGIIKQSPRSSVREYLKLYGAAAILVKRCK